MIFLNRVQVMGYLTHDMELKTTPKSVVCEFSLAVIERYKDKTGILQEKTTYLNLAAWGKLAEAIQNYKEGELIFVEGAIKKDTWETENIKHTEFKIVAQRVYRVTENNKTLAAAPENSAPAW